MKLVTWNCNGGLISKEKNKALFDLNPDIAIVQECSKRDAERAAGETYRARWFGDPKQSRGLAIFHKHAWKIEPKAEPTHNWIVACDVSGPAEFTLVAVWSCPAPGGEGRYIKLIRDSFDKNKDWFDSPQVVVAGDFNSNCLWDKPPHKHHASMVSHLEERGLVSAYHSQHPEAQGDESQHTFFMYRRQDKKPFHIDYIFMPTAWVNRVSGFEIGSASDWLKLSDHVPVSVDVDLPIQELKSRLTWANMDGLEYQRRIRAEWDDRT
jgi:exodeoxyribonuclease-3